MAALPLFFGALGSAGANMVLDGSFETPELSGLASGWCSTRVLATPDLTSCFAQGIEPTLGTFGPWIGNAFTYVSRAGGDFGLNGAPADGAQFGVLQSSSSWLQTIPVGTGGQYLLTWSDAGRVRPVPGYGGDQTYQVKVDGVVLATHTTVSGQPFTPQSLVLTLSSGNHGLRFSGQIQTSDESAYIDKVSLMPVPEPATASLFAAGAALIAATLRRRRRALSTG